MNAESTGADKRRLGELLVAAGALGEAQLQAALAEQKQWGEPLGRTLVQMGLISEELLVGALSRQLGLPACDPATMELAPGTVGYMGLHLVERYGVMPVVVDADRRVLFVATADPTDKRALAELGDHLGWTVQPVVAAASRIERAIRKHYFGEIPGDAPAGAASARADAAAPASAAAKTKAKAEGPTDDERDLTELRASLSELERLAGGQLRALRVLVEMLVEKGVIRHEDYLARMRKDSPNG